MALNRLFGEFGVCDPDDLACLKSVYDDIPHNISYSQGLFLLKSGIKRREGLCMSAISHVRPASLVRA